MPRVSPSADGQSVRAGAGRQPPYRPPRRAHRSTPTVPGTPAQPVPPAPHPTEPGEGQGESPSRAHPWRGLAGAPSGVAIGYRRPVGDTPATGWVCGGYTATPRGWRAGLRMPPASSARGSTSRPSSGSGRAAPPPRLAGATAVAAGGFAPRAGPGARAGSTAPLAGLAQSPSGHGTLVPGRGGSASGRNPLHGSTRGGFNGCR